MDTNIERLLIKLFGTKTVYHDTNVDESDSILTSDSIVMCDLLKYDKFSNFNVVLTINKSIPFKNIHNKIQNHDYIILNNRDNAYYYVVVFKKIEN